MVHVAPRSVPWAASGEASRVTVPVPSSRCHSPLVARAAALPASSGNGYVRTSSTAPSQKSTGPPLYLPAPDDEVAGGAPRSRVRDDLLLRCR